MHPHALALCVGDAAVAMAAVSVLQRRGWLPCRCGPIYVCGVIVVLPMIIMALSSQRLCCSDRCIYLPDCSYRMIASACSWLLYWYARLKLVIGSSRWHRNSHIASLPQYSGSNNDHMAASPPVNLKANTTSLADGCCSPSSGTATLIQLTRSAGQRGSTLRMLCLRAG